MFVHYHPSGLFSQSRCTLENWGSFQYDHTNDQNPQTKKTGIRCHTFIASLFLRLFGKIKIVKTVDGKSVYLNRKSFKKWIKWRGFTDTPSTPIRTAAKTETVRQQVVKTQIEDNHILSSAAGVFLEKISSECSEDLGEIWESLLSRIPTEDIIRFETIDQNRYSLKFKRPISLWLDSRSRDGTRSSPKGGTMVLLGHNNSNTLEFTTIPETQTIEYNQGMNFYCDTNTTGVGIKILDVVHMREVDEELIGMKAGCKVLFVFQAREKIQSKESYRKVWSQATLLNHNEDYKTYLKNKAKIS